jgi:hypothetical protein
VLYYDICQQQLGDDMASSHSDFFFSTYARTLISDWPLVKAWIKKHAVSSLKEQHAQSDGSAPDLLTEDQLYEIIRGPYQELIIHTYSAYAKIVYARQQHKMFNDDTFKDFSKTNKPTFTEKQSKQIAALDFKNMQEKLTELFQQHTDQWELIISQWKEEIVKQLQIHSLTDMEIREFHAFDPLGELINRFKDLNLGMPKLKNNQMNFADFLTLKSYLTVHSALSRQHAPNTMADIQTALKPLKPLFDQIRKQEQQLHEQQRAANEAVAEPLSFIVFDNKK